ncbi:CapA family protein [Clostridium aminobutyricum]|uniref:CapA family protein n=1 Tax=Clostridium aminobutyricum TaxID=33953 RepID=A0A939DB02_CLOAM|nr:CapA family protein [Clostridium aminobutyricum]MBN7774292.1 CapA family protein [Clostridium aminobutyricum]
MEIAKRTNQLAKLLILNLIAVGCLIAFPLLFSGCSYFDPNQETSQNEEIEEPEAPVELNITCVGDIMVHNPQIACQYDSKTGTYSYNNNYKYVKDYIYKADLALCNVETTFAGKPYTGYPTFSAPDALAAALKDTGFDVAMTANNHMMDKGLNGMKRTLEVLRGMDLNTAGSRLTTEEKRYAMVEVKDVKIAVIPYTYETSSGNGRTSMNGNPISSESAQLINSFSYDTIDTDLQEIKSVCEEARQDGAQIVILYYHWGEEYQMSANQWQKYMAKKSVEDMDVDIIFGSHPHVLQEMEYIKNETTGKTVPVFYSMGNFISNQRTETLDNRYTEQGILAQVTIQYIKSEDKITDIQMSAIPTWVEKYSSGDKPIYEIIPLDRNLDTNETLAASGHLLRAKQALEDANGILKSN